MITSMSTKETRPNHTLMVDSLDTAKFQCPACDRIRLFQVSKYNMTPPRTRVRYTCRCGCSVVAILERGKTQKKEMLLFGTFKSLTDRKWGGRMTVKKLNSKGLVFKTTIDHKIRPGHRLRLEFVLDDAKQSIVTKEVIVAAVSGHFISAQFVSREHFDNLGPYLLFNQLVVF